MGRIFYYGKACLRVKMPGTMFRQNGESVLEMREVDGGKYDLFGRR